MPEYCECAFAVAARLAEFPGFRILMEKIGGGENARVSGLSNAAKGLFLALLSGHTSSPLLWITSSAGKAERLCREAALFNAGGREICLLPERDESSPDSESGDPVRLRLLERLSRGENLLVVAPIRALLQKTLSSLELMENTLVFSERGTMDMEDTARRLYGMGYRRVPMVEEAGDFAMRGCILDIYPPSEEPVRLELYGDEIERLANFDVSSQISNRNIASVRIIPARENRTSQDAADYFPPESLFVIDEAPQIRLHLLEYFSENGEPEKEPDALWKDRHSLFVSSWGEERDAVHFPFEAAEKFSGRWNEFISAVGRWSREGKTVVIVTPQEARVREVLVQEGVNPASTAVKAEESGAGRVLLFRSSMDEGFIFKPMDLIVLTDRETLGAPRRPAQEKRKDRGQGLSLDSISEGDLVVHLQYGIGRYLGVGQLELDDAMIDCIILEYARGDRLFVPVIHLDLLQKYTGLEGKVPSLSRLGSQEWANTKRKVKASVEEMARGLLALYAKRESMPGYAFLPDTPWQAELEAAFPYEETPDQEQAIRQAKADMEKPRPMDRLICGDAGYGKTEVALRASFKAVMSGKQAAVLVPTTVLCQQHYNTFLERLTAYQVKIEMLSRFKSPRERSKIIRGLQDGTVDIVIGTHRLLQKDIRFKDLGLVIIDEEQHFGVQHKERLKELKENVDVLTLTATPIPRTLHMSIVGIRDMSVIDTPPLDRLPIKTSIFEWKTDIVRAAIARELERGGQVFVVHNRVQGIERLAQEIRRLFPHASTAVAHGQMEEEKLERVMLDFVSGNHDILVCTSIIESGLDIPGANTILINNAYAFGLAQLYQLRGRVGRARHQAYACLFYPGHARLSETAIKRLDTLRELTALGSGFQIALRDLEIRGAGNLLGPEQHGFIVSVGFDLYTHLLGEAVRELKGGKTSKDKPSPALDLPIKAYIPNDYVPHEGMKLNLYRRLSRMEELREVGLFRHELKDRFGPLPREAENLMCLMRMKILCSAAEIPRVRMNGMDLEILMPWTPAIPGRTLDDISELTRGKSFFEPPRLVINNAPSLEDWPLTLESVLRLLVKKEIPAIPSNQAADQSKGETN
jgi:transcription-repair coupling factor (superfamily II helicase)